MHFQSCGTVNRVTILTGVWGGEGAGWLLAGGCRACRGCCRRCCRRCCCCCSAAAATVAANKPSLPASAFADKMGNPKGFAYIEFLEADAVANACLLVRACCWHFEGAQMPACLQLTCLRGIGGGCLLGCCCVSAGPCPLMATLPHHRCIPAGWLRAARPRAQGGAQAHQRARHEAGARRPGRARPRPRIRLSHDDAVRDDADALRHDADALRWRPRQGPRTGLLCPLLSLFRCAEPLADFFAVTSRLCGALLLCCVPFPAPLTTPCNPDMPTTSVTHQR